MNCYASPSSWNSISTMNKSDNIKRSAPYDDRRKKMNMH
jgi:hypothetical protein